VRRMMSEQEDVYYYLTVMNENYAHPDMPAGAEAGIIKGMYLLRDSGTGTESGKTKPKAKGVPVVQLMGSGTILREVIAAAELLEKEFGVAADIWSCPSFNELRRDGFDVERWNRLHPMAKQPRKAWVTECLEGRGGPIVSATDYVRGYSDQVRAFIPPGRSFIALGTDGYGRSDTRAHLRAFFEVDRYWIAQAAITALAAEGKMNPEDVARAIREWKLDPEKPNPSTHLLHCVPPHRAGSPHWNDKKQTLLCRLSATQSVYRHPASPWPPPEFSAGWYHSSYCRYAGNYPCYPK